MASANVVAVIVTFNRASLLPQVIEAVCRQTRPPDSIVVVDNNSTDGTQQIIKDLSKNASLINLKQEQNFGGAGGFGAGIEHALKIGADWVWIMDDDVSAHSDCLEQLLAGCKSSEFLHPRRFDPLGDEVGMNWITDPITLIHSHVPIDLNEPTVQLRHIGAACFEGALISRRIIEAIGIPEASYFIALDDFVYGMKAAYYTDVTIVTSARMDRLLPYAATTPWKAYFVLRNTYYATRDISQFYGFEASFSQRCIASMNRVFDAIRLLRGGFRYVLPVLRGIRDGRRYLRTGLKPTRVHYP